jgi:hypothetical protein
MYPTSCGDPDGSVNPAPAASPQRHRRGRLPIAAADLLLTRTNFHALTMNHCE